MVSMAPSVMTLGATMKPLSFVDNLDIHLMVGNAAVYSMYGDH